MKKYVNMLLFGFLVFVIGLICSNVEFATYTYVDKLPNSFSKKIEKYTINYNDGKSYEFKKAKYNDNISISFIENNTLNNEINIEVEHYDTSVAKLNIDDTVDKSIVSFSNTINYRNINYYNISNLIIKSLKEKKMYDYNLLKYSRVKIYANEDVLNQLEIKDYE